MRKIWLVAVLVAIAFFGNAAAAGKFLVLESSPGMPLHRGQTLEADNEVEVPIDGVLSLLNEAGQAIVIKGPFKGVPGGRDVARGPGLLERVARILAPPSSSTIVLGATRALLPGSSPPDPWLLDVASGNTLCIKRAVIPLFWKFDGKLRLTASLRRVGSQELARLVWQEKQNTIEWPQPLQRVDRAFYEIKFEGSPARSFLLREAPGSFSDDATALLWLWDNGCKSQANTLVKELPARTDSNSANHR